MPSAERGPAHRAETKVSRWMHAKLFINGLQNLNLSGNKLDPEARRELLDSIVNHASEVLTAPWWQKRSLNRTMKRRIKDEQTSQDAKRILQLGADVFASEGIKNMKNVDPIDIATWRSKVYEVFDLSSAKEPAA